MPPEQTQTDWKDEIGNDKVAQKTRLKMPVIGMEAEFNVFLDGVEIVPEDYWKHPSRFIDVPMLSRTKKSSQLPTGGAVYFDRGVIEVVTPVIEIAPGCSARVVRNLWEQIEFVRDQLTRWEKRTGHHVRLKGYSTHYNVSFELDESEQTQTRNVQALALLLAYILPSPLMLLAANRRSTGIGVRPRGNRIEVTLDFTPDPGLMIAAATCVVGIVREVMRWPSYDLALLDTIPVPLIRGVVPGKHTTRKGWLTKDFHYPVSPFTCDIDAPMWETRSGRHLSLREIAWQTAWFFRQSIRRHSDPFSFRLLFAVLEGRSGSLLELRDRPAAYDDVGRLCRWGMVVQELRDAETEEEMIRLRESLWQGGSIETFVAARQREREEILRRKPVFDEEPTARADGRSRVRHEPAGKIVHPPGTAVRPIRPPFSSPRPQPARRMTDFPGRFLPPRPPEFVDRRVRRTPLLEGKRRSGQRRRRQKRVPFPDRRLTRSAYEKVFLTLVSGRSLDIGGERYRPVGMKGWYHAVFRNEATGAERILTIDQLLRKMDDWRD